MEKKTKKGKDKKKGQASSLWNKHKNEIVIGIILLCIVVICIICLVTNNKDDDNSNNNNQNIPGENVEFNGENNIETGKDSATVKEEDLVEAYGMTKDDALKLVKEEFNTDNFTFTVITTNDAKYMVIALNNADESKYYVEVNPATKAYYFIEK